MYKIRYNITNGDLLIDDALINVPINSRKSVWDKGRNLIIDRDIDGVQWSYTKTCASRNIAKAFAKAISQVLFESGVKQ